MVMTESLALRTCNRPFQEHVHQIIGRGLWFFSFFLWTVGQPPSLTKRILGLFHVHGLGKWMSSECNIGAHVIWMSSTVLQDILTVVVGDEVRDGDAVVRIGHATAIVRL